MRQNVQTQSKKQQQKLADLHTLETTALNLKANLKIHKEQLAKLLAEAKAEFGVSTEAEVKAKLKELADQLVKLQQERDSANKQALLLLEKMS